MNEPSKAAPPNRFLAYVGIVIGVFICLAGGCVFFLGFMFGTAGWQGFFALFVGIAMIVSGVRTLRKTREPPG